VAGRGARAADPLGRERMPGGDAGHLPPHAERDQLARRRLDEARYHRVSRDARERMKEAAAVRVRDTPVGPAREQQSVPRRPRGGCSSPASSPYDRSASRASNRATSRYAGRKWMRKWAVWSVRQLPDGSTWASARPASRRSRTTRNAKRGTRNIKGRSRREDDLALL